MRQKYDDDEPDLKLVVDRYRSAIGRRLRWLGPIAASVLVLAVVASGAYSVQPGEVAVVQTFGKMSGRTEPGLHFAIPLIQRATRVNMAKIRRAEVGFRSTPNGPKRVDDEAQMLTGDENIVSAQMIVQYKISDPDKYLFRLFDPDRMLHVAAEVALRSVVGQGTVTSGLDEMDESPSALRAAQEAAKQLEDERDGSDGGAIAADEPQGGKPPDKDKPPPVAGKPDAGKPDASKAPNGGAASPAPIVDASTDILTTGRERAQLTTRVLLQQLMDLNESGITVIEVKLQAVDPPDDVKDAFHDVVRAREEREKKINMALGYRQDRIPRARGEAEIILRAAEAYRRERVLKAKGEAARFSAILAEYRKAPGVTRERLHLETVERILGSVKRKVFIDEDVVKNAVPLLSLGEGGLLGHTPAGDKPRTPGGQ